MLALSNKTYPAQPLYSEETRTSSMEDILKEQEDLKARLIDEGRKLSDMTKTEGWKIFEASIRERIELCKEALIDANDPEIIRNQQLLARSLSNILGELYTKLSEADALLTSPTQTDLD